MSRQPCSVIHVLRIIMLTDTDISIDIFLHHEALEADFFFFFVLAHSGCFSLYNSCGDKPYVSTLAPSVTHWTGALEQATV